MPSLSPTVSVIGSGPNGLAAAVVCARAGLPVTVYEANATVGGGVRTGALTIPGFLHDHCASVFPLGAASPFFRSLDLERRGVTWLHAPFALAHPLEDGSAVCLARSLAATAAALGEDGRIYERLMGPTVRGWQPLMDHVLGPLRWPRRPVPLARFGLAAMRPATHLARRFTTPRGRALWAGLAAHSAEPLDAPLTSAFGLLLGALAHAVGWPVAAGGAQTIAGALSANLEAHGGRLVTGRRVARLDDLPPSTITLCDVAPEALARMAGARLPDSFRRRLVRFRRHTGSFKVDWALDGPIPWRAPECAAAATVHVGGSFEAIAAAEEAAYRGRHVERPFVIVAQPSVCDPSRAPQGRQAAWGYCHVPVGSERDVTAEIERQIERYAPGFRDRILARHVLSPSALEADNPNMVGGDLSGGAYTVRQLLFRPTWRGHATPERGLYLCSSSTLPGGGVHGMCGYRAARRALAAHAQE